MISKSWLVAWRRTHVLNGLAARHGITRPCLVAAVNNHHPRCCWLSTVGPGRGSGGDKDAPIQYVPAPTTADDAEDEAESIPVPRDPAEGRPQGDQFYMSAKGVPLHDEIRTVRQPTRLSRFQVTVDRSALPPPRKVPRAPSYLDPVDGVDEPLTPIQKYLAKMKGNNSVGGTVVALTDPVLPANPAEIAFLDPAKERAGNRQFLPDGSKRRVLITQHDWQPVQANKSEERFWHIQFDFENPFASGWVNPLMGWISGSEVQAMTMESHLVFDNAMEAVYFCKKQGWEYIVRKPIRRRIRNDEAQYQDNFLPQRIANRVQRQGKKCEQWKREAAGTSHYFRPLTYHGDGIVSQHGPNPQLPIAPHVEGVYKRR